MVIPVLSTWGTSDPAQIIVNGPYRIEVIFLVSAWYFGVTHIGVERTLKATSTYIEHTSLMQFRSSGGLDTVAVSAANSLCLNAKKIEVILRSTTVDRQSAQHLFLSI